MFLGLNFFGEAGAFMSPNFLNYIPKKSLSVKQVEKLLDSNKENINYLTKSTLNQPVIPFSVFGVKYLNDIVIETKHPKISMHELAQIKIGDDLIWIAKDSTYDGLQTLIVPSKKYLNILPEINLPRLVRDMEVKEEILDGSLFLDATFENQFGEIQKINFSSPILTKKHFQQKTNSSTFNHSKKNVSAVLDIDFKNLKKSTLASPMIILNEKLKKFLG